MSRTVLVTGGAGFIGSAVVRALLATTDHRVVTLDALTYAGHRASLADVLDDPRHTFVHADVTDPAAVAAAFERHAPDAVLHLAAESHVDRSIDGPAPFLRTNVDGTFTLLEAARAAWTPPSGMRDDVRFVHVSTDEVFGSLAPDAPPFHPGTPYDPRSPYAASKAASDHLARAWFHTYGLPVVVTNCSNNYGPRQFPEKLLPTTILRGAAGATLPVYGAGDQVRDWLHVEDHARGLLLALERGTPGRTYLFGGRTERTNLDVVRRVCAALDDAHPGGAPHAERIAHVPDRPGHDRRYAVDPTRAETDLGWRAEVPFEDGLRATVAWYLANGAWVDAVRGGDALDRRGLGPTGGAA
ncbi:MAG: dTDP-glucose 4,6-dehydratase [Trueperaceae bacterium]|nr:dTDP-glucose 4,6-dehydratase [Trueperaceae bacterium]